MNREGKPRAVKFEPRGHDPGRVTRAWATPGTRRWVGGLLLLCTTAVAAWIVRDRILPADPLQRGRAVLADRAASPASLSVVLITLDTLRADVLGCYGGGVATPFIDSLAREGVLFEQASATVPLTLPSHSSIMTGLLPVHHGVRDNGGFFLEPSFTTLAERLQSAGYATGAFVGSWVLERRWGLAQGFDHYSDGFVEEEFQRRGDAVVADALGWLGQLPAERRFLAWIHLFDAHTPYDAPEPFRSRYPSQPYYGEVAYVDALVGRILQELDRRGRRENTIVVMMADHGESLGDHGEQEHGLFVYDATMSVPLLVRTPWGARGRSRTQVSSVDIFPTVLDLVGLAPQPGIDGASLRPVLQDPKHEMGHVAYVETYFPEYHFGWHALQGLRDGRYKLIQASRSELYDLATDPGERVDISAASGLRAERMRVAMELLAPPRGRAPERSSLDAATRERLAALGYTGSVAGVKEGARRPDPKEKVAVYALITSAKAAAKAGRLPEAIAQMRAVAEQDPDIMDAHIGLGDWLLRSQQPAAAVASYKRALALKVDDEVAFGKLVTACRAAGAEREAVQALAAFRAGLEANPRNPQAWYQLAVRALELRQTRTAEEALLRAIEVNPRLAQAHNALGALDLAKGELDLAEKRVREALAITPQLPTARYNLGRVLEARGQLAQATSMYEAELSTNPRHGRAHLKLAQISKRQGDQTAYVDRLRRGVEQAPESGGCYFLLAHERLRAGEAEEALRLARRGLELEPASELSPLGHYVLADVYRARGQTALASTELARARRLQAASAVGSGSD
jgi:arylsulfatase A-like enzyme/Tfp pilus assembly protein PilF